MASESFSDIAIRILYSSVSVLIVTAICIYNYLSRTPKKSSSERHAFDNETCEKSEGSSHASAGKVVTSEEKAYSKDISERKNSGGGEASNNEADLICFNSPPTYRKPSVEGGATEYRNVKPVENDVSKDALFFEKLVNDNLSSCLPPKEHSEKEILHENVSPKKPTEKNEGKEQSHEQLVRDILNESFFKGKPTVKKFSDSTSREKTTGKAAIGKRLSPDKYLGDKASGSFSQERSVSKVSGENSNFEGIVEKDIVHHLPREKVVSDDAKHNSPQETFTVNKIIGCTSHHETVNKKDNLNENLIRENSNGSFQEKPVVSIYEKINEGSINKDSFNIEKIKSPQEIPGHPFENLDELNIASKCVSSVRDDSIEIFSQDKPETTFNEKLDEKITNEGLFSENVIANEILPQIAPEISACEQIVEGSITNESVCEEKREKDSGSKSPLSLESSTFDLNESSTESSSSSNEVPKVKTAFQKELEARLNNLKLKRVSRPNEATFTNDLREKSLKESASAEKSPYRELIRKDVSRESRSPDNALQSFVSESPKNKKIDEVKAVAALADETFSEEVSESAALEICDKLHLENTLRIAVRPQDKQTGQVEESNVKVVVDESSSEKASESSPEEASERKDSIGSLCGSEAVGDTVSAGSVGDSNSRRHSDIGTTDAISGADTLNEILQIKKFNRKSLPADFLGVLGSGLQAQRARIGPAGTFSVQNLREDPETDRRRSTDEERPLTAAEMFQREIKSKANMRLTRKNRDILAAQFKHKFTVGDDLFKMIPSPTTSPEPEALPSIQHRFQEAQELLSKQLRQPVIPKTVSPTADIVSSVNGSGDAGGGGLADRLGKLETAAQGWKKRVGPTDAVQFSVAGRMKGSNTEPNPALIPPAVSPSLERKKKVPKPTRFKSKSGTSAGGNNSSESDENAHSPTAAVPEPSLKKSALTVNGDINLVKRGASSPAESNQDLPKVEVPSTYDDSFSLFFSAAPVIETSSSTDVMENFDLDALKTDPSLPKLAQRRTIKVQRRREASRNPLKVLAARKDLKQEYTEVKTGVAENELRRLNVEKLSKNSNLAVEALAGLASREDFTAVSLKKPTLQSNAPMLPYKNLMLLLVKGRRHVQTRLVEPTYKSINKGDTFVLVTPNEVYLWLGEFSNVIERSRGGEVATHIAQTKDLGCTGANNVITITDGKPSIHAEKFWTLLGASKSDASKMEVVNAGHLDEDEIYEISLVGTNMVYEVESDELIPVEKFWGNIPKIEMLDANKIFVFDFGTELYVWNGKNASMDLRKVASKLAQELWDEGYNYTDCDISPINASLSLGFRNQRSEDSKTGSTRPAFALIGKVTQHMETVLFREKFLDWPDFNRVIRTKSQEEDEKQMVANLDLKPCDSKEMLDWEQPEPDFILEGSHLGRGTEYFDDETRRFFAIRTTNVSMWRIEEFESAKLEDSSVGQFYSGDSYIVQWLYTVSVTGRELSGMPSKHNVAGRDRCAYFIWQGRDASLNEQGAAALLTVELDKERGPQVRIIQGHEPPAFWNLFNGSAIIHRGKRSEPTKKNAWRLYMVRGELENETQLVEVICNIKHLRSRGSFILINPQKSLVFIWHGSKSPKITRKSCSFVANNFKSKLPQELGLTNSDISIKEFSEGEEPQEFFDGLGGNNRHLYHSLLNDADTTNFSQMKLFHLSSMLGVFQADPVTSHSGSYLQQDLYSASQPALFLLDTSKELWLWQGWWPIDGDPDSDSSAEDVGSGGSQRGAVAIRWQAERRAAMETALNYWKNKNPADSPKANLVWAGLEPTEFTNLFPEWMDRDDVAELNIRDGRKPCEILSVERELMRLTKSTYPPEVLLQRPLPEGVDPTRLELYLEPKHFKELLGVTKEEFSELPLWKQTKMKKEACLF